MDIPQDIHQLATYLTRHAHRALPSQLSQFLGYLNTMSAYIAPFASQVIDRIYYNPDLASIFFYLVIFYLSLKILQILFGMVMYWIRLFLRLVFWSAIILTVVWIAARGVEAALGDARNMFGGIIDYWGKEYEFWRAQAEIARAEAEMQQRVNQGKGW